MIGGGMQKLSDSFRSMSSVLPKEAKWIKDEVVQFNPVSNSVLTRKGDFIEYDLLLVAVGLQLQYDKVTEHLKFTLSCVFFNHFKKIPGLSEALSVPNGNVTSIYSPKYVNRHLNALKQFEKGNIIFTFPASPVKCPGAPQKICYITEDYLRIVS